MNQHIKNCPFCNPLVETACFAESDNFRAVYNIAPILPGHCLVIPKKHCSSYLDIPDSQLTEMIVLSKKIIKVLNKAFGTNAYDWTIQEGAAAGQTIDHMHMHIIPRKQNDLPEPGDWYPCLLQKENELIDSLNRAKFTKTEMQIIVTKLKDLLNK